MPELPEVETTRLSLLSSMQGATITQVWQGLSLRFPLGCRPEQLLGQRVEQLKRRGKYLLFFTQSGVLLVHLGMSGSLLWHGQRQAPARSAWVRFELHTDKGVLQLDDPRRFGAVVWHVGHDLREMPLLASLGPEPLEPGFDGAVLYAASRGKTQSVKQWLLAGHAVVGVGNIYACEVLFRAAVNPAVPAGRLSRARAERIAQQVKAVLTRAIEQGGTTLRDFSNAHGEAGLFQHDVMVYDRQGQPCKRCTGMITRIVQGQRSTYYCPRCQKR